MKTCNCALACKYYAILEVLEIDDEQLPKYRGRKVVDHIIRVKASNRCVKYSLFFMLSRMLGFWHSVCSTKYPCLGFYHSKMQIVTFVNKLQFRWKHNIEFL